MKIKKQFLLLFFMVFFLLYANNIFAQCCLPSCSLPDSTGLCSDETLDSRNCDQISQCNSNVTSPTSATTSTSTTTFPNPIPFTTLPQLLGSIMSNLMGIIAIVAVIFIVIGGIMYLVSGGNEAAITRAKKTIAGAVIGLAIALAAPTFLKEIYNILGKDSSVITGLTFYQIAANVLNFLLSILGIIAIISLIVGGGMYLTAYGDEDRIQKGKNIITYAIIGIIIALAALVIVRQVSVILAG